MVECIRKGIILAGGNGTRLAPLTSSVCKQLLPVYDKPMIYYSLATLMLSDIREILLICRPNDVDLFKNLLGNGNNWGIDISYSVQDHPRGLADAFIIGESFIRDYNSALILGDNLFYGNNLSKKLRDANNIKIGATIFAYQVENPSDYGVVSFRDNIVTELEEKPQNPKSNYAVTGLYFYDQDVCELAKSLKPSKRGELEITDLNNKYLQIKKLNVQLIGRGNAWLDMGSYDSLIDAGQFIRTIEKRQILKVACLEEIAWRLGWISDEDLEEQANKFSNNNYGKYLIKLLERKIL